MSRWHVLYMPSPLAARTKDDLSMISTFFVRALSRIPMNPGPHAATLRDDQKWLGERPLV